MENTVKEIHEKYGDIPFLLGLINMMCVGSDNYTKKRFRKELIRIRELYESDFVDNQNKIIKCAYELSKTNALNVLNYIQENVQIEDSKIRATDSVTHEGKIISFWQNCTEGIIAYIIVPSETTDETIDKAVGILTERMNEHERLCHDFCNFDYSDNIIDAFKECGISAKILSADREISL